MAFETPVKSIDKLKQALQNRINSEIYIDASIKKGTPDFIGFPMHYNYIPVVLATTIGSDYLLEGEPQESPDEELVRCSVRVNALELGLNAAMEIASGPFSTFRPINIKVNDLPLTEAKRQLDLYKAELARIKEKHKNQVYL